MVLSAAEVSILRFVAGDPHSWSWASAPPSVIHARRTMPASSYSRATSDSRLRTSLSVTASVVGSNGVPSSRRSVSNPCRGDHPFLPHVDVSSHLKQSPVKSFRPPAQLSAGSAEPSGLRSADGTAEAPAMKRTIGAGTRIVGEGVGSESRRRGDPDDDDRDETPLLMCADGERVRARAAPWSSLTPREPITPRTRRGMTAAAVATIVRVSAGQSQSTRRGGAAGGNGEKSSSRSPLVL